MNKIRFFVVFLGMLFFSQEICGQIDYYEHPGGYLKDTTIKKERKIKYGFDFGMTFGYATDIRISLQMVYPLTSWNAVGVGFNAIYSKYRGYKADFIYGPQIFDEFYLFKNIIIHSEYQELHQPDYNGGVGFWEKYIFFGPGYKQNITKNSYLTYLVLWNFSIDNSSIMSNPDVRVCFYF